MNIIFIQKSESERITLGIVYEPGVIDCQGDFSDAKDIEKACHGFMQQLQGQTKLNKSILEIIQKACQELGNSNEVILDLTEVYEDIQKGALGYNHESWPDDIGQIAENYIMPVDCEINGEKVRKGSWMMAVQWSPKYFQKIQSGEIAGYSMGGAGHRIKVN